MPYSLFNQLQLDQLYLPFLQKVLDVAAACKARGCHFEARAGFRSFEEQERLFNQGRTTPGPVVTDALPGYSAHNYGLAVDFARLEAGRYLRDARDYAVLGQEAAKAGLSWGGTFHHLKDAAHVQLPGYVDARELEPLRQVYLAHPQAPLSSVWEYLDGRAGGHA